ncbi:hypothetical protein GCM10009819_16990 [Agromyces tropicus]|uniref:Cell wall-binding repeat-containing protein n=1 Tax=Agromyces tropicus TaxID=555371 RepID=A0ABP5FTB8_9MICO
MDPNPSGRRPRSLVALLVALLAALSIWQPSAAFAEEVAPNLVSLERTSPDVVAHGDQVVVAWEFDAPVESVTVNLRDALGGQQFLYAEAWVPALTGRSVAVVDTSTWPGGPMAFDGINYSWTAGGDWHFVELDAAGEVRWSSDGLAPVPAPVDAMRVTGFDVESDLDLSTPPALRSATRTSGDTLVDGDVVEIAWEFDRAVDQVAFTLRDGVGRAHRIEWYSWDQGTGPSTSGVATMRVDTPAWAGGDVVFGGLDYSWSGGYLSIDEYGVTTYKQPEGLADATLPEGGLAGLGFSVESDFAAGATPHLTSLVRTSPDVVVDGDEVAVDWAFDAAVDSVVVVVRDALGAEHHLWSSTWGPADSGRATTYVDAAEWPAGVVELDRLEYSWASGGDVSSTVALDANGEVLWSWGEVGEIPSAAGAMSFAPFEMDSDLDLTVPPVLAEARLVSGDVVAEGDEVQVAWSFDVPVDLVRFWFRDDLGERHPVEWSVWQGTGSAASTEGVATATVDTTSWAGGAAVFDGLDYEWHSRMMSFDADGSVLWKEPAGLQDVAVPIDQLSSLAVTVESDLDLGAVPALTSVTRLSGDVVRDGIDTAAVAWEVDAPIRWISFVYEDGMGRMQSMIWTGDPATSGVADILFEGASWAPGDAELLDVRYSTLNDRAIVLDRDGSVASTWPEGLDAAPYEPGFADLDFTVETDAVFQTVDVPAPVFTDATCDAPAHLLLEDFDHGWWSWTPGGIGYGGFGDAFDGEPWLPYGEATFTVTAMFEDGWGTTGTARWTHSFADPGSCEPLLDLESAPTPTITGDPLVGSPLAVAPGDWQPAPVELAFQWFRDGVPVAGATEPVYELTAADARAGISVEVTGSKDGYAPAIRASDPVQVSEPAPTVTRVPGDGRFASFAAGSASSWAPGVETAIIVNGVDETSAVAGAALAGASGAPLLAVKHRSVPVETADELGRLAPQRIVVVGGDALVADAVVDELAGFAAGDVSRIDAEGPFALAAAVSASRWQAGVDVAYLVDVSDRPSALAASALAAASDAPILAVADDAVPSATAVELERLAPAGLVVVGDAATVTDAVLDELAGSTDGAVTRIAGPGRFGTTAAVSSTGWPSGAGTVFVVNGSDTASATAAAALAGASGSPLLTVKRSSITSDISDELRRLDPNRVVVLGDANAIDGSVLAELAALIGA